MYFSGIVGHEEIKKTLLPEVTSDEFYGSFVFTGPKGIGKALIAKRLAKYSACLGDRDDQCACSSCLRYPDSEDIKFIDAQGSLSIKLSALEDLEEFLDGYSRSGGPRFVVVDEAEKLTIAAASLFLKILESKDRSWAVIFVTGDIDSMMPTVVSRSQKIEFKDLSKEEIKEILKMNKVSTSGIGALASHTSYLSKSLLSHPETYSKANEMAFKLIKALVSTKESALFSVLDMGKKEIEDKNSVHFIIECLILALDDLLKIRLGASREVKNSKKMDFLKEISERIDEQTILAIQNQMKSALKESVEGLGSPIESRFSLCLSKAKHAYTVYKSKEPK
jgi:DNA polymerase-3 subunit delta'